MKVHAIGYEQDPSGTRIAKLMDNPTMHLIDCRFNPHSWRSRWCKNALVEQYGERYHFAGRWLGNAKHPSNQMFRGHTEIELIDSTKGIAGLSYYLQREYDLILLCKCLEYRYCHLQEIVTQLQIAMPEVEVILPEAPPEEARYKFPNGAKVFLKRGKEEIPAIVLDSAFSAEGNYDQVRLRVAQYNEMGKVWIVSDLPKPVQSYKLKKRGTTVLGLDE